MDGQGQSAELAAARILIVDDNSSMREAISIILEDEPDLVVCGEASDISEATKQCEALQPHLALVDLSLQGEDGLELIKYFREREPELRTVVLSLHDEQLYIDGARDAGAHGYVIKTEDPDDILACIRGVLRGDDRFPPADRP